MANVSEVAKFLLFLKENDPRNLDISNLKIQKLLYYCQGYYLHQYKEPLFNEKIEAWKFGPVVPEIYFKYNLYGDGNIELERDMALEDFQLQKREISIIAYVWKKLGEMRAGELVDKTHSETPWLNAWIENKKQISNESIAEYFVNKFPETLFI